MPTTDSMVTARMSAQKKAAGARVLADAGLTASQALNRLYDYLISFGTMPPELMQQPGESQSRPDRGELLKAAVDQVDAIPRVELDAEWASMSAREARGRRLASREPLAGDGR